jgi:hypothetical protein
VTDCPDGPVSLIAGVPVGDAPSGVTNTCNEGPEAGAGAQLKAQPMFQPAAVVVKVGLVQLPFSCVGPRSTRAGPAAAVDDVEVVVVVDPPAAAVVVVEELPEAAVVVVVDDPPVAAVVVVVAPEEAGSLYAGASAACELVLPAGPAREFTHAPTTRATRATTASCHVRHARLSLMWSSPGAGQLSGAVPVSVLDGGGSDMSKP